jgi:hypothetical protein
MDINDAIAKHTIKYAKLPKGFREDRRTGQVACPHRDLSCCATCAPSDFLVEVHGQHHFAMLGRAAHEQIRAAYAAERDAEVSS